MRNMADAAGLLRKKGYFLDFFFAVFFFAVFFAAFFAFLAVFFLAIGIVSHLLAASECEQPSVGYLQTSLHVMFMPPPS